MIASLNKTVRPTYEKKTNRFSEEAKGFDEEEKEEGEIDPNIDDVDTMQNEELWNSQDYDGRQSHYADVLSCCNGVLRVDNDGETFDFEAKESNNGHSSLKRRSAFHKAEQGVNDSTKEAEDDIDFDDIEGNEENKGTVDEDQENLEDLEGTIVKDHNSSDNANDIGEDKRRRGSDEDADDVDDGEKDYY
ncbi:unnamed protein product [Hydatigera taeniaeformis]|uniref:Uncharacterized protein n=1 Tax=Hydatigena taeniaeformis TaxID=6205 RepID=A0A0R3XBB8_HYDTA|nr:unnamed protein product [Hydatigera taeniaeformis]